MRHKLLMAMTFLIAVVSASGVEVTAEQAAEAAQNWAMRAGTPLGAQIKSRQVKSVRGVKNASGRTVCHFAELNGGGFVVLSSDTEIDPVVAFSGRGNIGKFEGSPLEALLSADQTERIRLAAKGASVLSSTHSSRRAKDGRTSRAALAWACLLNDEVAKTRQESVDDERVGRMLVTEWDQSTWGNYSDTANVFNYCTPGHYVCGCVATAMAQIMYYWKQPSGSVARFVNNDCEVNGKSDPHQSLGGVFDWNGMLLKYEDNPNPSEAQCLAIGHLTYDCGVAVGMNWTGTSTGSSASTGAIPGALKSRFGYASGSYGSCQKTVGSPLGGDLQNMLYASLDARMPVSLSIGGTPGGHSIVADGYGYTGNVRYTHLNMGWSGEDDVWYNLMGEEIYTDAAGAFTVIKGIGFNLHPFEVGAVVSGQVRNESGAAVSGATVQLSGTSGNVMATATSDINGIYSFRVTNAGTYRVRATRGNAVSLETTVTVSASGGDINCGNRWGNDLTVVVTAADKLSDLYFVSPSAQYAGFDWPQAAFLSGGDDPRTARTQFKTAETICLNVGFGNCGEVAVPSQYKIRHVVVDGNGQVIAEWLYNASEWDLMEPGDVSWWDDFAWEGLNDLAEGSYVYRCTLDAANNVSESNEGNNTVEIPFTVVRGDELPISVAVDNADLSFSTGGAAAWYGQGDESFWGGSSARSGAISDNRTSWMETTVSGAGWIEFSWKVSSESGWDELRFSVDGELVEAISGETGWTSYGWEVGEGDHTFRWAYEKDSSQSRGQDCGWVDAIHWKSYEDSSAFVTFDPNGGWCDTTSVEYSPGSSFVWLPRPVRSGWQFCGWRDEEGEFYDVESIVPYGGRALTAVWQPDSGLAAALLADGSEELSFVSGGDSPWMGQQLNSWDDDAAAYSGVLDDGQVSWLETVVEGPGCLSFAWMESSESGYDSLRLEVDGQVWDSLTPDVWWLEECIYVEEGTHVVRWIFEKDGSYSQGWDCGFLDAIHWEPEEVEQDEAWVTFYGNGGLVEGEYLYEECYGIEYEGEHFTYGWLPAAKREGFRFDGWYTADGRRITADIEVDPEITELYAHWTQYVTMDIGRAVNGGAGLQFQTGGPRPWFGQNLDSYDGDGAAQSGQIGDGESSWLETECTGAGTLSFWWKCSSESGYDTLTLTVDGVSIEVFSGQTGWQFYTYEIPYSGSHAVRWTYAKDGSVSEGEDCARIDSIAFGEAPQVDGSGYALCVGVNEYDSGYIPSSMWLSCCAVDADNVASLLTLPKCKWGEVTTLLNREARKETIVKELKLLAVRAQPGDRVIYYHSSHGGQYFSTSAYLCSYDDDLSDTEFADVIAGFASGVRLLIVIDACHSAGMFKSVGPLPQRFDAADFAARVNARLGEIRRDDSLRGRKGPPCIQPSEIGWVTASDYDESSWGGVQGSDFTIAFADAIRSGMCDLEQYGGNGDGGITALEAASYTAELLDADGVQHPQLANVDALASFTFVDPSGAPPTEELPNLRWHCPDDWSAALYLNDGETERDTFAVGEPIYMAAAFQNTGKVSTKATCTIRHELYKLMKTTPIKVGSGDATVVGDLTYSLIASWDSDIGVFAPSENGYSYWDHASWDGLNGLGNGAYKYRCVLDPDNVEEESDESDNEITTEFKVVLGSKLDITFVGLGGECLYDYYVGAPFGELPTPSRDGYEFMGWFTEAEGGMQVTETTIVQSSMTRLYAHWAPIGSPDLIATGLTTASCVVAPGESVALTFVIRNAGGAPSPRTRAAVKASLDGNPAQTVGFVSVDPLDPGADQSCSFTLAAGRFAERAEFFVIADCDDAVVESDESNNETGICKVSVSGAIERPEWLTAEVESDVMSTPIVFRDMLVRLPDGSTAGSGGTIAVFRSDTESLCGRAQISSAGRASLSVMVPAGVTLHFLVWIDGVGVLETSQESDIVAAPSSIHRNVVIQTVDSDEWEMSMNLAKAGWHLISFNALPEDASPDNVLSEAADKFDCLIAPNNDYWFPGDGSSSLKGLEVGIGYWAYTLVDDVSLTIVGEGRPDIELELKQGWNLVGYPLRAAYDAADVLATALAQGDVAYVCTAGNSALCPFSRLEMSPGCGYWLYAEKACSVRYDSPKGMPKGDFDIRHPWSSLNPIVDQCPPTVIDSMRVTVDGQAASKGDVVAAFDSEGNFYAAGIVTDQGKVSMSMNTQNGKRIHFLLWRSASGLDQPTILADGTGASEFTASSSESIRRNLAADFHAGSSPGPESGGSSGGGVAETAPAAVVDIVEPEAPFSAPVAATMSGAVLSADGQSVAGVVQLKVGKEKKGESKVSLTLIGKDGKKYTAKAVNVPVGAGLREVTFDVKGYGPLTLTLGADGFIGKTDDALVAAVDNEPPTGPAAVELDLDEKLPVENVLTDYLPTDITVERTAKKWTLPKAGKLKYDKKSGELVATGDNIAGLKLTYATKTQTVKGSFKIWTFDEAKQKLKSVSASVTGVVVGGVAYCDVSVKKLKIGEMIVK